MDVNELLVFIHILGAIVWVGGDITVQFLGARAVKATDPAVMQRFGTETEWIGMHVFMPASIVVLAAGIGLVLKNNSSWDWEDPFVVVGLLGIAFSIIVGSAFLGPESGRVGKLTEEKGPADPEVKKRISRLINVSRFELLVLVVVVFFMAVKPGT